MTLDLLAIFASSTLCWCGLQLACDKENGRKLVAWVVNTTCSLHVYVNTWTTTQMTHLFPFFLVSIMYTFMFFAGTFQRFLGFCSDGETGLFNQYEQVTKASRCRTE